MTKDKQTQPAAGPTPPPLPVLVDVHRAIAFGGLVVRPIVEGKRGARAKIRPVRAVIPADLVAAYGRRYVTVVGDVAAGTPLGAVKGPMPRTARQAGSPADKQVTEEATK